ncbi:respiratory nitrate reductase subunit gamma [Acidihalobacter prosperus]|uniref:respiratory nitrate reductase subunit gamma n=1 Tax=Acidihalobacter prosperus TaxID=160660 RepID=UPI0038B3BB89
MRWRESCKCKHTFHRSGALGIQNPSVPGLTAFLLFPFTRLVHIWSAPVGTSDGAIRSFANVRPDESAAHGRR